MTKFNVRIIIIDIVLNTNQYVNKNDISAEEKFELWKEYVGSEFRGSSGSRIGYEAKGCPEYTYQTGVISKTSKFVTFLSWKI